MVALLRVQGRRLRLTGVAHKEAHHLNVRVVGLSPGTVATKMQEQIRDSGVNPVSRIPWENHITPDQVAKAVAFLTTREANKWLGADFSLKDEEGRRAVGVTS